MTADRCDVEGHDLIGRRDSLVCSRCGEVFERGPEAERVRVRAKIAEAKAAIAAAPDPSKRRAS